MGIRWIILCAALISTSFAGADGTAPSIFNQPNRDTQIIRAMITTFVVYDDLPSSLVPDPRTIQSHETLYSSEIEAAGLGLHRELGARYEAGIAMIARRASPEKLAWVQKRGPKSQAAYEAYLKARERYPNSR